MTSSAADACEGIFVPGGGRRGQGQPGRPRSRHLRVRRRSQRRDGMSSRRSVSKAAGEPVQERKAVDVLAGVLAVAAGAVRVVAAPVAAGARAGLSHSGPLARVRPPDRLVAGLADRGVHVRAELERRASAAFAEVLRQTVEAALSVVSLTDLVRRHVDLDALAREIDVGAVVARVDPDAVAARLDLEAVLSRVDLDAVVARVDPDLVVLRVDVDAVASRVDLGALVARIDPDAVAKRLDVDAVVSQVDLEAIVARLDLPRIALEVIAAIDLAEIVRQSTGSAASEVIRGIRAESVQADDAVARTVDRLLRRQRRPREQR